MTVSHSFAAASMVALGLWALPTAATAMPIGSIAADADGTSLVHRTSGYDGYGFGIEGDGCDFGHGGGTGYKGCFIYEKGHRYYYGYAPSQYGKKPYGKRDTYRSGNGYKSKNRKGYR